MKHFSFFSAVFLGFIFFQTSCSPSEPQENENSSVTTTEDIPAPKEPAQLEVPVATASQLRDAQDPVFPASHLADGRQDTWWRAQPIPAIAELALGAGEQTNDAREVAGIQILGGAHNPIHPELGDAYYAYGRLRKGRIFVFSPQEVIRTFEFSLEDTDQVQFIAFPTSYPAQKIQLQILEIYPGKQPGAAISVFQPLSRWPEDNYPLVDVSEIKAGDFPGSLNPPAKGE